MWFYCFKQQFRFNNNHICTVTWFQLTNNNNKNNYNKTDHLIPARRPNFIIINEKKKKKKKQKEKKKKRTCKIVDFAVPVDHRVKLKENEKKNNYLDLTRELKILWNMKVMFIPIIIGTLSIFTKELIKGQVDLEIKWRVETVQTTALLRSARILREVLESWGYLLSLKLQWKTISKRRCEKLSRSNNNNNGKENNSMGVLND